MSVKDIYNRLMSDRAENLWMAEEVSRYTIPAICPPEGYEHQRLPQPTSSVGAHCVKTLSAKLSLIMMPPTQPFFRFDFNPKFERIYNDNPELQERTRRGFARAEKIVWDEINSGAGIRTTIAAGTDQEIVTGGALYYIDDDMHITLYRLHQYVVDRDGADNIRQIIIKETIAREYLPDNIQQVLKDKDLKQRMASLNDSFTTDKPKEWKDDVEIYTHVRLVDNKWHVSQEVEGCKVDENDAVYPKDACPYIYVRCIKRPGCSYGDAYAYSYLGAIKTVETLNEAVDTTVALANKLIFACRRGGSVNPRDLASASNGGIIAGAADDVGVIGGAKGLDLQPCVVRLQELERQLYTAFLVSSNMIRDAERVTAEEVQRVANEVQQTMSVVYGLISAEFQQPFLRRIVAVLTQKGKIPDGLLKYGQITITTGLTPLGRMEDAQRKFTFVSNAVQTLGGDVIAQHIDIPKFLGDVAGDEGLLSVTWLKSPEQIAQERKQAQQAQQHASMMQAVAGPAVNQLGSIYRQEMQQQNGGSKSNAEA